MKELGELFLVIIILFFGAAVSLLYAKVTLSVATLYNLEFLMNFSFVQMYGIFMVFGIFSIYSAKVKFDEEKDFEDNMVETITISLTKILMVLIGWVMAFIMHGILT